ncbi:MAG TPA: trypsin-like peptidase domain-containing protein [Kofleriaceae bacterium]|jgi:S1-C subfamily serine protease
MRLGFALIVPLLLSACGGKSDSEAHSPRMRLTPKDVVQQSSDGVVRVQSGENKVGSGFILDKSGLVATNLHVVVGEKSVKVKLHDGSLLDVVEIAGYDPVHDLALLRIKPQKPLVALRLGDSQQVTAGDQVTAIGNPLGVFDYSVTNGLISAVRDFCAEAKAEAEQRHLDSNEVHCPPGGLTVLQISVPISQGSSGGPLFNQFGEVVGITTAIIQGGQSINLAMPANYLKPMLAKPGAQAMPAFAAETQKLEHEVEGNDGEDNTPIPPRQVPHHPIAILDGCSEQQIKEVAEAIGSAIEIGAPLYNQRTAAGMEGCFRVYEGTATKLEHDPPCPGVGKAFGEGLLRASTLSSYKDKAWAMRDTFDGLTDVSVRKLRGLP